MSNKIGERINQVPLTELFYYFNVFNKLLHKIILLLCANIESKAIF